MSFYRKSARIPSFKKRPRKTETRRTHAGQSLDPRKNLPAEIEFLLWLVAARHLQREGQHVQSLESGIQLLQILQAAYNQAAMLATQRIQVALLTAMSSLALLLSALGIFALVTNLVTQRTREIGIRIALGATTRVAMIDIGKSGVGASVLGLIMGLILCARASRFAQRSLRCRRV